MSSSGDMDQDGATTSPNESDGVAEQLDPGDTLIDRGVSDPLDEGYSPPDRESHVNVPTENEEHEGESLEQRLAEEVPDVGTDEDEPSIYDESGTEVGGARSGRLVDSDLGEYGDTDKELWAGDVGIDGAGASAEEAAVHVIDDEEYED